jgi:hypothetical protein
MLPTEGLEDVPHELACANILSLPQHNGNEGKSQALLDLT